LWRAIIRFDTGEKTKILIVSTTLEDGGSGCIISGWRRAKVLSVGDTTSAVFYIQMDDVDGIAMGDQACHILENSKFCFFVLLQPAVHPQTEQGSDIQHYRRVGALMMYHPTLRGEGRSAFFSGEIDSRHWEPHFRQLYII
jgi:hypothetical protein